VEAGKAWRAEVRGGAARWMYRFIHKSCGAPGSGFEDNYHLSFHNAIEMKLGPLL